MRSSRASQRQQAAFATRSAAIARAVALRLVPVVTALVAALMWVVPTPWRSPVAAPAATPRAPVAIDLRPLLQRPATHATALRPHRGVRVAAEDDACPPPPPSATATTPGATATATPADSSGASSLSAPPRDQAQHTAAVLALHTLAFTCPDAARAGVRTLTVPRATHWFGPPSQRNRTAGGESWSYLLPNARGAVCLSVSDGRIAELCALGPITVEPTPASR